MERESELAPESYPGVAYVVWHEGASVDRGVEQRGCHPLEGWSLGYWRTWMLPLGNIYLESLQCGWDYCLGYGQKESWSVVTCGWIGLIVWTWSDLTWIFVTCGWIG